MAMELEIYSPQPGQKFPQIKWNNEQLKADVEAAMADYQGIVVTLESEKDSKALRARLNKLLTTIETARKDMKAKVQEPLKLFEAQVKEVEAPINKAISNLDSQLNEIKLMKQEQKRRDIDAMYAQVDHPDWLTLDKLWDDKWLNVSVALNQVREQVSERVRVISGNMRTIKALPEFSYEAEEFYKQSLDFGEAVRKAKEMSEMQKRKAQIEAERLKGMPATQQNVEEKQDAEAATNSKADSVPVQAAKQTQIGGETVQEKVYTFRFEVCLTAAQAAALGNYCREQGITLTRIQ